MSYQYSKVLKLPFSEVLEKVEETLLGQGFSMQNSMDVKDQMRSALGVQFRNYRILTACIPELCYRAISLEPHVGIVLPCNIIVQEHENGNVEISAINPMESLDSNMVTSSLQSLAAEISIRLRTALDTVNAPASSFSLSYN